MNKSEERAMARFLPKRKLEAKESPFAQFKKTWYLDWWLPKLIFVLGFICILWKLFDIFIMGRFP